MMRLFLVAAIALPLFLSSAPLLAQPAPPATTAAERNFLEIKRDINTVSQELAKLVPSQSTLLDPAARAAVAEKAVPLYWKMVGLMREAGNAQPSLRPKLMADEFQFLTILTLLGDQKARAALESAARTSDPNLQITAQTSLLVAKWLGTNRDPAAQQPILEEVTALAKAHPDQPQIAVFLLSIMQMGAASPAHKEAVHQLLLTTIKGPLADRIRAEMARAAQNPAVVGKELVIQGRTLDGSSFSTAAWKGKVILVDFWASWCGQCKVEQPRVIRAYQKYHDQGLEVLGISSDNSIADLKKHLAQTPQMVWPQLFEPSQPGWHPLASTFNLEKLPALFLIDRKGILRSVDAESNFETEIPKMLAEPG